MTREEKLQALGHPLPEVPKPVAAYVPAVKVGSFVYTSGQLPTQKGELLVKGKLGREVTVEEGQKAARQAVLNALAAVKSVAGSLENIEKIVKLVGFVASHEGFTQQPQVVNGASELLKEVFGEAGEHARSAVGVAELPLGAPVEIELVVALKEA
ncbi:MAG: RidA family protein [Clostridiales bacterium]|nr:RidA family protein [Clostridiales bacterium]